MGPSERHGNGRGRVSGSEVTGQKPTEGGVGI